MILAFVAALIVAIGGLIVYDRGYSAAAMKYESTYREAIDKHRAEQARERGAQVIRELRERVRNQARARTAGKVSWE